MKRPSPSGGEDPDREDRAGVGVEQPHLVVLAGAEGWQVVGAHGHLLVAAVAGHAGPAAGGHRAHPGQGDAAVGPVGAPQPAGPQHRRRGHGQGEGGGQADKGPAPPARPGRPPARPAGLDGRPRRGCPSGGAGRGRSVFGGRVGRGGQPEGRVGGGGRLGLAGGGAEGGGGGGEHGQLAPAVVAAGQVVADHHDLGPVQLPEQQAGQLLVRVLAHRLLIPMTCPIRRSPLNIRAFTVPSGSPSLSAISTWVRPPK